MATMHCQINSHSINKPHVGPSPRRQVERNGVERSAAQCSLVEHSESKLVVSIVVTVDGWAFKIQRGLANEAAGSLVANCGVSAMVGWPYLAGSMMSGGVCQTGVLTCGCLVPYCCLHGGAGECVCISWRMASQCACGTLRRVRASSCSARRMANQTASIA
eukprot:182705-Chlamydomonas_euryale.AAC.18